MSRRTQLGAAFAILLIGVALRLWHFQTELRDNDDWGATIELVIARNHVKYGLARTFGLPVYGFHGKNLILYATHPYLSFLMLAACLALGFSPIVTWRVYHMVVTLATALVLARLVRRRGTPSESLFALAAMAWAPVLIHLSRSGATETPFLLFLCLYWLWQDRAAAGEISWLYPALALALTQASDAYALFLVPVLLVRGLREGRAYLGLACIPLIVQAVMWAHLGMVGGVGNSLHEGALRGLRFLSYWISPAFYASTTWKFLMGFGPVTCLLALYGCIRGKPSLLSRGLMGEITALPVIHLFLCSYWMAHHTFFVLFGGPALALWAVEGLRVWSWTRAGLAAAWTVGLAACLPAVYAPPLTDYVDFGRKVHEQTTDQDCFLGPPSSLAYYIDRPDVVPYNYFQKSPGPDNTVAMLRTLMQGWTGKKVVLFSGYLYDGAGGTYDYSHALDGLPFRHVHSEPDHSWEVWTATP